MRGSFLGQKFAENALYVTVNYRITSVERGPTPTNDVISVHCYPTTIPEGGTAKEAILILLPLFPSRPPKGEWANGMFRCVGNDARYGILADIPKNREYARSLLSCMGDNLGALRMSEVTAINRAHRYLSNAGISFEPNACFAERPQWGFGWTVHVMTRPDRIDGGILVEVSDDGRIRNIVGVEH
jgi:hypothetical protein